MTQTYPRSETKLHDEIAYVSIGGNAAAQASALQQFNKAVEEFQVITHKGQASLNYQNFSDLDTRTSSRPGLMKSDYYKFRTGEAPPNINNTKAILLRCDEAYQKVGIIRNVIDLMGDFACQGIRIVHPNKRIEKFFQNWFVKVKGMDRSERFCNNLCRLANVVVRKHTAKITTKIQDSLYRSIAQPDMTVDIKKVVSKEIPFKYVFLNPSTVDIVGNTLSTFAGKYIYTINIPMQLRRTILYPKTVLEKEIIKSLPEDIIKAAKTSTPYVLPEDKTRVFHYKKDDWQTWALPMTYAILDDVAAFEKLRLADMAALDGAISNIRIFKLGSLEHKIMPAPGAASKLARILQNNVGAGTIDLIWGPDLEFLESKTAVHQFLGEEKYRPHLSSIYGGLGIPPTLVGAGGTGTTNNYISLKTLIQRLQYVRNVLISFWAVELVEVQKAMGFRFPPKIEFDVDILDDEQAMKTLLVQLVDRGLISDELLQLRFGHDPELENIRLNREQRDRDNGRKIQKAGPFYDSQFGLSLKKVALQSGILTPGQVGLNPDAKIYDLTLYPRLKSEKNALELRQPAKPSITDNKSGIPQQGRPKNSKDTTKRKTKRFSPKLKANLAVWLKDAQDYITEALNDYFLDITKKKNMRSLSALEVKKVDKIKFNVLFNLEPFSTLDYNNIYSTLDKPLNMHLYNTYSTWVYNIANDLDRSLTMDELKQIQIVLYSNIHIGDHDNVDDSN
jgi:hypothetical protein